MSSTSSSVGGVGEPMGGLSSSEIRTFQMVTSGETDLVNLLNSSNSSEFFQPFGDGERYVERDVAPPLSFMSDEFPDQSKESWENLPLAIEETQSAPLHLVDSISQQHHHHQFGAQIPGGGLPIPSSLPTVTPEAVFPGLSSSVFPADPSTSSPPGMRGEEMDLEQPSKIDDDADVAMGGSSSSSIMASGIPEIHFESPAHQTPFHNDGGTSSSSPAAAASPPYALFPSPGHLHPAYVQVHTLRFEGKKLVAKDRVFDVHVMVQGIGKGQKYVTSPVPEKWTHSTRNLVLKVRMHDTYTSACLHPNVSVCVKRLTKAKDLEFIDCQSSFSVVIRKASVEDWPPVRRCKKREFKLRCWLEMIDPITKSSTPVTTVAESETIMWAGNRRIAAKASLCEMKPWPTSDGSIQWPKIEFKPSRSPDVSPNRSSPPSATGGASRKGVASSSPAGAIGVAAGGGVGGGTGVRGHLRSRSLNVRHMRVQGLKRKDSFSPILFPHSTHHFEHHLGAPMAFDSLGEPPETSSRHAHSLSGSSTTTPFFSSPESTMFDSSPSSVAGKHTLVLPPGSNSFPLASTPDDGALHFQNGGIFGGGGGGAMKPPPSYNSRYPNLDRRKRRERRYKSLSMTTTLHPPVRLEPTTRTTSGGYDSQGFVAGGGGSHRRSGSDLKKMRLSEELNFASMVDTASTFSSHSFQEM